MKGILNTLNMVYENLPMLLAIGAVGAGIVLRIRRCHLPALRQKLLPHFGLLNLASSAAPLAFCLAYQRQQLRLHQEPEQ